MLQSIAEQCGAPRIVVDVSGAVDNVLLWRTLDAFADLDIRRYTYPLDILQYRGLTRNDVVARADTEWILFSDSDMVFSPTLFRDLAIVCSQVDTPGMVTAGRQSCPIEQANALVDSIGEYPCRPVAAYQRCCAALDPILRSNVGAGYFQLIRKVDCGGYYVEPAKCRDAGWERVSKCRSDAQFRRRVGKARKLPVGWSYMMWHLNHERDNQHGHHLEDIR